MLSDAGKVIVYELGGHIKDLCRHATVHIECCILDFPCAIRCGGERFFTIRFAVGLVVFVESKIFRREFGEQAIGRDTRECHGIRIMCRFAAQLGVVQRCWLVFSFADARVENLGHAERLGNQAETLGARVHRKNAPLIAL